MLSMPLLIDRNLVMADLIQVCRFELDRDAAGTSFTDTNALMESAVTGQVIALGRLSVTFRHLAGKLIRLSEHSLRCLMPIRRLPIPTANHSCRIDMQPAENGPRLDTSKLLNSTVNGRILAQRHVCARRVILTLPPRAHVDGHAARAIR